MLNRNRQKSTAEKEKELQRARIQQTTGVPPPNAHSEPSGKRLTNRNALLSLLVFLAVLGGTMIVFSGEPKNVEKLSANPIATPKGNKIRPAAGHEQVSPLDSVPPLHVPDEDPQETQVKSHYTEPPRLSRVTVESQRGDNADHVIREGVTTMSTSPESTAAEVLPVPKRRRHLPRHVHRFWYNATDGERREVHFFTIIRGVHIFAVAKNAPKEDERRRLNLTSADFYRSRFACLCVDATTSAEKYHLLAEAVGQGAQRRDESLDESTATTSTDAVTVPSTLPPMYQPSVGRHRVHLGDGTRLETRVLPCTGRYYGSTSIGLCDPNANGTDTVEVINVSTSEPTNQWGQRSSSKKRPEGTAMVPVAACSDIDAEVAREVLTRRLFNAATLEERGAFFAAATGRRWRTADGSMSTPTTFAPFDMDMETDAAEMGLVCDQCGGSTISADVERNTFNDAHRFRKLFFERKKHTKVLRILRDSTSSRCRILQGLIAPNDDASSSVPPTVNASGSVHKALVVVDGLRAMDSLALECDKKRKSEHFAQCFAAHGPVESKKRGNWSHTAEYRIREPYDRLQLRPSRFFSTIPNSFPIPSRLTLHPLNVGGHIVCYAGGDMVCDIVGRTGGWENELIQIVAFALSELRRLTRVAASILAARFDRIVDGLPANDTAVEVAMQRYMSRDHGEFSLGPHMLERDDLSPLEYADHDVTFVDVGGNVGVFAASLWKRGYRTEVFEALPQNVFLLESSRCTNQAEEFANWEDKRSTTLHKAQQDAQQRHATRLRNESIRNNTTLDASAISEELRQRKAQIFEEAEATVPRYYRISTTNGSTTHGGPWIPGFEVHHAALGNGKRGRSGDEAFLFALNVSAHTTDDDEAIAIKLNQAARDAVFRQEGDAPEGETQQCVMISEQHNFGDIVILCNQTLVAEAHEQLLEVGPTKARVLSQYIPRGFVNLTSLDRLVADPAEGVVLQNVAMQRRFEKLLPLAILTNNTENHSAANAGHQRSSSVISSRNTTLELLQFVSFTQIAMKIDVEGQEEYVMQGANSLLGNHSTRPKLILSEIWRKMNVARYGAYMIDHHGYIGLTLGDSKWLRTSKDVVRFHRTMSREMDTIVWVLPQFQFLIPPSAFGRTQ